MIGEDKQTQGFDEVSVKFKEMLHLSDEVMIKLYAKFFETMAVTLEMLKDAIAVENYDAIKLHAHSIKGTSLSLCYNNLSNIAQKIEKKAEVSEQYEYEKEFSELYAQFNTAHDDYVLWMHKRG
jgi:HPt (histidine-containing phosphotransfer) domain-containing protein